MSYPVTAIVNPALTDNESLLFYATQKGQLALQRWSFKSSVQATDFHENGLWQGPIVLPSALASFVQRGLVSDGRRRQCSAPGKRESRRLTEIIAAKRLRLHQEA